MCASHPGETVVAYDLELTDARELGATLLGLAHVAVRLTVAILVAKPAFSKVLTYESSVSLFSSLGIPFPALMVLVAGVVEVVAVSLLLVGVGYRVAALALIPVMLVAIVYAGPDWKNLAVLLGALSILALTVRPSRPRSTRDPYRG